MFIKRSNKVLLTLTIIISLITATACSGGSKGAVSNSDEETKKETIIYQAINGEVEIPKEPKRVVVIQGSYVGYLLQLGMNLVGAPDIVFENTYYNGKLDEVEAIGDTPSLEKVLDLKPDLIIIPTNIDNIEEFEKIAPTIAIKYGEKNFKEQLREFGKMLGKEKEAEDWITSWDKKIAELKPIVHKEVGNKTVSLLGLTSKEIYAYGHNYGRGGEIIYEELQLKAPMFIQKEAIDTRKGWTSLSHERLPEYAGDYIFVEDYAEPESIVESTLWNNLPAVKDNKVFQIDPGSAYFSDPITLEKHLDFIVESLTGKK